MRKSMVVVAAIGLISGFVTISFASTASFQGLGVPVGSNFSGAFAVSNDGSVAVGFSAFASDNRDAFRWTASGGLNSLGDIPGGNIYDFFSEASGVSGDGSVVVGHSEGASGYEAFRWTESGGMVGLGDLGGGYFYSRAEDVSNDGTVVVGEVYSSSGYEAFRWTESGGMVGLGDLGGGDFVSKALGISPDGSVVVGRGRTAGGPEPFLWTQDNGMVGLGLLPDADYGWAEAASANGSVVTGMCSFESWSEAFRWTESGGMQSLGRGTAYDISADGSIVVGLAQGQSFDAFIWDEQNGMQSIQDMLENDFGLNLNGWSLGVATGISPDGLTIVGYGTNPEGYVEAWVAVLPEPIFPPVANANGPYSIYVGDALTLDASGSTDADDDIVSFLWDLDDDETFETDAGNQAVFDVNYTYLQSLGLLINYTYTIHLKVTDSEQQSDTADSTLIIVPKPAVKVGVDIKPGSCPNPINVKSSGVLPVAILGTEDVNVLDIVPTSIRLAGVEPLRDSLEDVGRPVWDSNDCNCITDGPDGFLDLTLKFETQRIVEAIGDVNDGDVLTLELTGVLFDPMPFETPIEGADCILIRGRHKSINLADINKDGIVNILDFAVMAKYWLKSSEVED